MGVRERSRSGCELADRKMQRTFRNVRASRALQRHAPRSKLVHCVRDQGVGMFLQHGTYGCRAHNTMACFPTYASSSRARRARQARGSTAVFPQLIKPNPHQHYHHRTPTTAPASGRLPSIPPLWKPASLTHTHTASNETDQPASSENPDTTRLMRRLPPLSLLVTLLLPLLASSNSSSNISASLARTEHAPVSLVSGAAAALWLERCESVCICVSSFRALCPILHPSFLALPAARCLHAVGPYVYRSLFSSSLPPSLPASLPL